MEIKRLNGLIAAVFAPMNEDGSIKLGVIKNYAQKLKDDGLSGVFINGTSGEGVSLSLDERKAVLEEWIRYGDENFKILVHVGTNSYVDSMVLAEHAQNKGVDGIASISSTYFKPESVDQLVEYCRLVASAAPRLPFYYYVIPSFTGINLSVKDFLIKGGEQIPTLAGIKFTHSDISEMQGCINIEEGKFDIIHGFDEMLIGGLALGIKAAIGSTYNYMAPVYLDLIKAFNKGDLIEARRLQGESVALVEILMRNGGGIVAGKAVTSLLGIDVGPCRLPLKQLSSSELDKLKKELNGHKYFEV